MLNKILFREYNYGFNTISTEQGSPNIIGTFEEGGFNFNSLVVGCRIEIEISQGVSRFIGKVLNIIDSSHIVLDRNAEETFTDCIFWVDWTLFYLTTGGLSRRLESDFPGKAGAVCFDNLSLSCLFGEIIKIAGQTINNPILKAFQGSIDNKKRFIIRLQAVTWDFFEEEQKLITHSFEYLTDDQNNYLEANYKDNQSTNLFEGMIDFTTIEYPDIFPEDEEEINEINFEVVDKLSAMNLINRVLGRSEAALNERVFAQQPAAVYLSYGNYGDNIIYLIAQDINDIIDLNSPIIFPGEILADPQTVIDGDTVYYIVLKSEIIAYTHSGGIANVNKVTLAPNHAMTGQTYPLSQNVCTYLNKEFLGIDINDIVEGELQNFNAIKIIEALVHQRWPDISSANGNIINRMYTPVGMHIDNYPIPVTYFEGLIYENPFGKEPLEALVFLASGMLCYMFFDRQGNFILHRKDGFPDGSDKSIPANYIKSINKKEFWDMLCDAVTVKAYHWKLDEYGEILTGEAAVKPIVNGTELKIKPRNEKEFEVFVDNYWLNQFGMDIDSNGNLTHPTLTDQQEIIDEYAYQLALRLFPFYGKRHTALSISLAKNDKNIIRWDLMDTFVYGNKRYFTESINLDNDSMELELVSIDAYEYNKDTVLIRSSAIE